MTGEMPFRHIILRCERDVLIPRPETEILVDAALEGVDAALRSMPRVLEIGAGTGCIACSIAAERKDAIRAAALDSVRTNFSTDRMCAETIALYRSLDAGV